MAGPLERVSEGDDVARVDAGDGFLERVDVGLAALRRTAARSRACRPSRARSRAPSRQRGPVSSRSSAGLAVGSSTTSRVATTSATSGMASRPPRPTTSTGRSCGGQRGVEVGEVAAGSDQNGDLTGLSAAVDSARSCSRQPGGLVDPRGVQRDDRVAEVGLVRRCGQLDDGVPAAQDRGHRVGQPQQPTAGALVDRQACRCAGVARRTREVRREAVEVGHRRAAPPVDRLARVADRRDRVAAAEESRRASGAAPRWCPGTRRAGPRRPRSRSRTPTSGTVSASRAPSAT